MPCVVVADVVGEEGAKAQNPRRKLDAGRLPTACRPKIGCLLEHGEVRGLLARGLETDIVREGPDDLRVVGRMRDRLTERLCGRIELVRPVQGPAGLEVRAASFGLAAEIV